MAENEICEGGRRSHRWSWQGESHIYKAEDKDGQSDQPCSSYSRKGKWTANEQIHSPTPDSAAGRASQVAKATPAEHEMETSVCTQGHGQRRPCPKHLPVHRGTPGGGAGEAHFHVAPSRKSEQHWCFMKAFKPYKSRKWITTTELKFNTLPFCTTGFRSLFFVLILLFVCLFVWRNQTAQSWSLLTPAQSDSLSFSSRRTLLFWTFSRLSHAFITLVRIYYHEWCKVLLCAFLLKLHEWNTTSLQLLFWLNIKLPGFT